jgi:hypothetical protein
MSGFQTVGCPKTVEVTINRSRAAIPYNLVILLSLKVKFSAISSMTFENVTEKNNTLLIFKSSYIKVLKRKKPYR